MNIFDLDKNWQRLDEVLEETGGEITPEIEALLNELVNESKGSLERAGFYRRALENQVAICKERRAALAATIERCEAKMEKLNAVLTPVLKRLGKPQKVPEFTMSTQTRESVAFAVKPGVDLFELDESFIRVRQPELNLVALKEARKDGILPEQIDITVTETTSVMMRTPTKKADAPALEATA